MAQTILIVDDSPTTRNYVRSELERLGFTVVEATDGSHALRMLEQLRPALVISDVNMAPMDGLTFLGEVRKRLTRAQLPVLMLTTEAGDDLKARGKTLGASGWLTKPFDPKRMGAVIQHLLAVKSGASDGGRTA